MTKNREDKPTQKTLHPAPGNEAFRRGLISHLPALRRFAMTLCRNKSTSDDLVQGTCERALGRSIQFTPGTRMESWLFAIMHSIWKNELRRNANQHRVHTELKLQTEQICAERQVFGKIELSEVLSALNGLTTDQAAAITLVSLEGLSYREAADILSIPQGTLESRIARGRIALGKLLEGPSTECIREPDYQKISAELKSGSKP